MRMIRIRIREGDQEWNGGGTALNMKYGHGNGTEMGRHNRPWKGRQSAQPLPGSFGGSWYYHPQTGSNRRPPHVICHGVQECSASGERWGGCRSQMRHSQSSGGHGC